MSDEYTPTTADVQVYFSVGRYEENRCEGQVEFRRWLTAHDAEVARQQAERDIEIAKSLVPIVVPLTARSETKRRIAHAIRAQFANPSTTPKETR